MNAAVFPSGVRAAKQINVEIKERGGNIQRCKTRGSFQFSVFQTRAWSKSVGKDFFPFFAEAEPVAERQGGGNSVWFSVFRPSWNWKAILASYFFSSRTHIRCVAEETVTCRDCHQPESFTVIGHREPNRPWRGARFNHGKSGDGSDNPTRVDEKCMKIYDRKVKLFKACSGDHSGR